MHYYIFEVIKRYSIGANSAEDAEVIFADDDSEHYLVDTDMKYIGMEKE